MKINPVAIQSYQQISQRRPNEAAEHQKQADEAVARRDLSITPQEAEAGSKLAVKAPKGSYAEYLTDAERSALELIFQRYADTGRFGSGYAREAAEEPKTIGNVVDLKV